MAVTDSLVKGLLPLTRRTLSACLNATPASAMDQIQNESATFELFLALQQQIVAPGETYNSTSLQTQINSGGGAGNTSVIGKTSGAIAKGSADAAFAVYSGAAGSETATGATLSVWNSFGDIGAGKWAIATQINSQYYFVAAEC